MSLSKGVSDTNNVPEKVSFSSSLPSSFSGTKNTSLASLSSSKRNSAKIYGVQKMVTLASLLRYFEGLEIIVELKTGNRHQGILQNADDDMNMTLVIKKISVGDDAVGGFQLPSATHSLVGPEDQGPESSSDCAIIWASVEQAHGKRQPSSQVTIRGSQVRYVQFPDNANLSTIVLSGREREQQARNRYRKTVRKTPITQS
jgi:small nuclear ribonucleoprotein (snRNP)-like protein